MLQEVKLEEAEEVRSVKTLEYHLSSAKLCRQLRREELQELA
jgi:hypothetical protein